MVRRRTHMPPSRPPGTSTPTLRQTEIGPAPPLDVVVPPSVPPLEWQGSRQSLTFERLVERAQCGRCARWRGRPAALDRADVATARRRVDQLQPVAERYRRRPFGPSHEGLGMNLPAGATGLDALPLARPKRAALLLATPLDASCGPVEAEVDHGRPDDQPDSQRHHRVLPAGPERGQQTADYCANNSGRYRAPTTHDPRVPRSRSMYSSPGS